MKLWTIQDRDYVWSSLATKGYISPDPAHSTYIGYGWEHAYHWMMKKMAERIPNYSGDLPVWAWTRKPDGQQLSYMMKEPHSDIILHINVPKERVLVSDFVDWHHVLNDWYLGDPDREWTGRHTDKWFDSGKSDPHLRRMVEASWERVFDVRGRRQACVDRVYPHEIVGTFTYEPFAKVWSQYGSESQGQSA